MTLVLRQARNDAAVRMRTGLPLGSPVFLFFGLHIGNRRREMDPMEMVLELACHGQARGLECGSNLYGTVKAESRRAAPTAAIYGADAGSLAGTVPVAEVDSVAEDASAIGAAPAIEAASVVGALPAASEVEPADVPEAVGV